MIEEFYTVSEIAEKLKLSIPYIYKLVNTEKISCFKFGKSVIFSEKNIDEFIKKNSRQVDRVWK